MRTRGGGGVWVVLVVASRPAESRTQARSPIKLTPRSTLGDGSIEDTINGLEEHWWATMHHVPLIANAFVSRSRGVAAAA